MLHAAMEVNALAKMHGPMGGRSGWPRLREPHTHEDRSWKQKSEVLCVYMCVFMCVHVCECVCVLGGGMRACAHQRLPPNAPAGAFMHCPKRPRASKACTAHGTRHAAGCCSLLLPALHMKHAPSAICPANEPCAPEGHTHHPSRWDTAHSSPCRDYPHLLPLLRLFPQALLHRLLQGQHKPPLLCRPAGRRGRRWRGPHHCPPAARRMRRQHLHSARASVILHTRAQLRNRGLGSCMLLVCTRKCAHERSMPYTPFHATRAHACQAWWKSATPRGTRSP